MSPLVTHFYAALFPMVIWTVRKKGKKQLTSKGMKISGEQNVTRFFTKKE